MEKVWEELKKIEAEAELIVSDAQTKAKEIVKTAEEKGEQLLADSRKYAEEEANALMEESKAEASQSSAEMFKANAETIEKLRLSAANRMEKAVNAIVDRVLENAER